MRGLFILKKEQKTWLVKLSSLFLFVIFSTFSFAGEYPYSFRSAYFLGRGDTGIASSEEENAIFYNPAGLALGTGIYKKIVLLSPYVEVSSGTRNIVKQISLQEKDPIDTLRMSEGVPQHLGLNTFSGVILRRMAFGAYTYGAVTSLLFKDPAAGAFEAVSVSGVADAGVTFSLADKLFHPQLYWGVTSKYLQRAQAGASLNATDKDRIGSISSDELFMTGRGGGVDMGLLYRGVGRTPVSFGLTIADVGNTKFTPQVETELSEEKRPLKTIRQTVNLGMAIEPGTRLSKFKLLCDLRDITNAYGMSSYKRSHFGAELTVKDLIGFNFGLNQGYPTFGVYLDIRFFRIDAGFYSEETGDYAGHREDQRFFFKLATAL